jgi:hypothetical protein
MSISTTTLREQIDSGLLLRGEWSTTTEDGRARLCAYTALMNDPDARPGSCPVGTMPEFLAHLIPWMDDAPSAEAWPGFMRRLLSVAERWHVLSPESWEKIDKAIRVQCIREAMQHVTVGQWGVLAARQLCIDAIEGKADLAAASAVAYDAARTARAASAAASAAYDAARTARAASAAASAAYDAARTARAASAAASDRLCDFILSTIEAAIAATEAT